MISILGILNVTPDSFSDGGQYLDSPRAIDLAKALRDEGADIVDIGGDSTRPGSQCVGVEEEWRRVGGVVAAVSRFVPVSIDSHHPEVVRRAVLEGATVVNDVSGGSDPNMWEVVREAKATFIVMHSIWSSPHMPVFDQKGDVLERIEKFVAGTREKAASYGVPEERLVIDPGMGAFLGGDAEDSWRVIRSLPRLGDTLSVCVGVSRKGFLACSEEEDVADRDIASAYIGARLAEDFLRRGRSLHVRVHNVKLQRQALSVGRRWSELEG